MATWKQVVEARNAGYSDAEILDRLAQKEGAADRVATARSRGFSDDKILERFAKKMGQLEAAGMGAVDAATFNLTDELAGAGAYGREMKDQGYEMRNPAVAAVTAPLEMAVSPLSGFLSFPFGGAKRKTPTVSREEAQRLAGDRARSELGNVREAQDRSRVERPGSYLAGNVAGAVATLPVGGPVAKGVVGATQTGGRVAATAARAVPGVRAASRLASGAGRRVASFAPVRAARTAGRNLAQVVPAPVRSAMSDVFKTVARGSGYGAAYGAAAGAGDARGGINERVSGAATGAGAGVIFGAPAALVLRYGAGGVAAFLKEKFGRDFAEKALAMMVRRSREAGVDLDDMVKSFYREAPPPKGDPGAFWGQPATSTRGQPSASTPAPVLAPRAKSDTVDETVGELLGQGNKDLQVALANRPGPGKEIAARTFIERGQTAGRRINRSFADALKAEGDDFYDEAARLKEKRMTDPEEPYKAGHAAKIHDNEWFNIIDTFKNSKRFRDALEPAASYAEDFRKFRARNEIRAFEAALEENAGKMTQTTWRKIPRLSVEALDYVERMVSDNIEYLASRNPAQASGAANIRDEFRKLLPKELNDARAVSASGFDTERALQEGRTAFSSGVDFEEMVSRLQGSTPASRDAYVKGVARGIYDSFNRQSNFGGLADAARRVQGSDLQRQKLLELMPKRQDGKPTAAAQRLLDRLDREAEMAGQAKAALGNSQTAPRQAAMEAAEEGDTIDNIAALIAERLTGQGGTASERAGRFLVDKMKQPGIRNASINRELATRLFATGRDNVIGVLKEVRDYSKRVSKSVIPKTPARVGVATGARAVGQAAAGADPYANDYDAAQGSGIGQDIVAPKMLVIVDPATDEEARQEAQKQIEPTLDTPERWERYRKALEAYGLEPLGRGPAE